MASKFWVRCSRSLGRAPAVGDGLAGTCGRLIGSVSDVTGPDLRNFGQTSPLAGRRA